MNDPNGRQSTQKIKTVSDWNQPAYGEFSAAEKRRNDLWQAFHSQPRADALLRLATKGYGSNWPYVNKLIVV